MSNSTTEAIEPYRIAVSDDKLELLKTKLAQTTFPKETDFTNNWAYGTPLDDIKRLTRTWEKDFDWRRVEAELNDTLPQFTTKIGVTGHEYDLKIHFVHKRSERADAIPLLFVHGWPGSFLEVSKILPLLTAGGEDKDEEPAFHVVAPSLPNFGFSQGTSKPGFATPQYAEVCHKLMLRLGYERYATQGGDWGFPITRIIGSRYPAHVLGSHVNFILAQPPSVLKAPGLCLQYALGWYSAHEKAGLARTASFRGEGQGYARIQGSKPHTLGFGLADSPVALLAWVYEKLRDWTDDYPWTDEEVLTWVSVYAFSVAGADASSRIYYEETHRGASGADMGEAVRWNGGVPLGISYFPKDVVVLPSSWGRTLGPVVYEKRHEEGGHFAAFEKPELLVSDVRKMFGKKSGIGAKLAL
ncbi:alpha/beta-hydrolase [Hypoxylon trugodes]|uniref:alpha/beta-hydrolase n=1 Tax=Hypoxylon trugodes TaxID=326681 RepID=UPI00219384F6|nr:alpha/beta-hydrolase [Hypoxylon trugodes]KAI1384555.1 alpha/beta-hydrolase [Hypoxylon trugodes]